MSNLPEQVAESIRARELIPPREKILVAVSGGVDSMVLLHLLHELATKNSWRIVVAHLNHQLRGKSSDADERLVVSTAKKMKVPVVVDRADVKTISKTGKLSVEMAARKVRHEFLARTAARLKIKRIALAHHADDQIELFFLRLFRGTGTDGLAGMKWTSPSPANPAIQLVRPLLNQAKDILLGYAAEKKIRFREDACNASFDIRRNRIRHELLPLLRRRYQPALDDVVTRLMEVLQAESEFLLEAAREEANAGREFERLPLAIQRRRLQQQLLEQRIPADFELIERLRNAVDVPFSIAPQITIKRDALGRIHLATVETGISNADTLQVDLGVRKGKATFAGKHLQWRTSFGRPTALPKRQSGREFFDAERVGPHILLRHWRPGDRFQPIGMAKPLKLQDFFTNQKIPRAIRHKLVVATTEAGEIFWVEGLRIGEAFKLAPDTRHRLEWRWTEERV